MTIRITDNYMASVLLGNMNRSLANLLNQQRMAGSMSRLNSFADDPRAVGTVQRYRSLLANNDEYLANVSRNRLLVDSTDGALQSITDALSEVRVIALRESSALGNSTSHGTSAVEVQSLVNRLMDVLNTSVEGNYIFSGRAINTPPFARTGNTVLYQGDGEEIRSRTGPNSTMPVNIPGGIFLGSQNATLGGRVDVAPRLQASTALADLNLGGGWQRGSVKLTDGAGGSWLINLSAAVTAGDVVSAVNAATGGAVTAGINANGTGFVFNGTGPLAIVETAGGTTAAALGIRVDSTSGLLTGRDIRPKSDEATALADIASLAGKLPLGSVAIQWEGTTYTVDLSEATTLGDLRTAFRTTVPGMELTIRNSSLLLTGGSASMFQVSNADGSDTATTLGLAGDGSPRRLFGMLEDLQAALAAGNKDGIRSIIAEFSSIEDVVFQALMRYGGRQNDLDWADGILRQRDERLRSNLSLELDVDVAKVAADLTRAETTYQASLLVASRMSQTNLMQFLR